jgi:SAM-dependent methyltransferase
MASQCVRNRRRLDTADEIMLATLGGSDQGVQMLNRGDMPLFPCILALITLVAVSVCATGVGAQGGMFSAGDGYERFMGRWSRDLAPLLVKFAGVRDGDAVLDVGSGTGALTAAVVAIAPASRIVGIDPTASYVAFAQTRHSGDHVRFEVGDAQQLRFADASFNRTLSLLVFNFIPDRSKALDEMIRVTRPGGIVASAVWDYGEGMEMLRVFWDEAVALSPAADARDERHMPLSRKGELDALWRAHRLRDVSEEALTIRTRFSSFDDYWLPFLERQGPAGDYVSTLTAGDREQLRMRLRKRLLGDGPDHPIVLSARAWAVRGIVPGRVASVR